MKKNFKLIAMVLILGGFVALFVISRLAITNSKDTGYLSYAFRPEGKDFYDRVVKEKGCTEVIEIRASKGIDKITVNKLDKNLKIQEEIAVINNVKSEEEVGLQIKLSRENPEREITLSMKDKNIVKVVPVYNERRGDFEIVSYESINRTVNKSQHAFKVSRPGYEYSLTPYVDGRFTVQRYTLNYSNNRETVELICNKRIKKIQLMDMTDNNYIMDEIFDIPASVPIGIRLDGNKDKMLLKFEIENGNEQFVFIQYDKTEAKVEFKNIDSIK